LPWSKKQLSNFGLRISEGRFQILIPQSAIFNPQWQEGEQMEKAMENARKMLADWKGDSYTFGFEVLGRVGDYAATFGKKALLMVAELGEAWVSGTGYRCAAGQGGRV
jgi:hypothetical protein